MNEKNIYIIKKKSRKVSGFTILFFDLDILVYFLGFIKNISNELHCILRKYVIIITLVDR